MKKLVFLAVMVVLVGCPALAIADSVSYNSSGPIPSTLTDWTDVISFPKFNPALGTLTQVVLSLNSDLDTILGVIYAGTGRAQGTAQTRVRISVSDVGGYISGTWMTSTFPAEPWEFDINPGPGSQTSDLYTASPSKSNSYTLAALLAEFTGTGHISLDAGTYTTTVLEYSGGYLTTSQITHADLDGTVTYYYNAVPVPPSALLLGSGLVGLLALARRRRNPR